MKSKNLILAAILSAAFLSGCGGQAYRSDTDTPDGTPGGLSGSGSGGTPGSGGTLDEGFLPAIADNFSISGPGGVAPTYTMQDLITDNILRVKVIAGSATYSQIPNDPALYGSMAGKTTAFQAQYYCIKYSVRVAGLTKTTRVMAINGGHPTVCPGAPSEDVLDFSSRMVAGHGPIDVTVTEIRDDARCVNLNDSCGSLTVPWATYMATGTLEVQTNGTQFNP